MVMVLGVATTGLPVETASIGLKNRVAQLESELGSEKRKSQQLASDLGREKGKRVQLEGDLGREQRKSKQLEGDLGSEKRKREQREGELKSERYKREQLESELKSERLKRSKIAINNSDLKGADLSKTDMPAAILSGGTVGSEGALMDGKYVLTEQDGFTATIKQGENKTWEIQISKAGGDEKSATTIKLEEGEFSAQELQNRGVKTSGGSEPGSDVIRGDGK